MLLSKVRSWWPIGDRSERRLTDLYIPKPACSTVLYDWLLWQRDWDQLVIFFNFWFVLRVIVLALFVLEL